MVKMNNLLTNLRNHILNLINQRHLIKVRWMMKKSFLLRGRFWEINNPVRGPTMAIIVMLLAGLVLLITATCTLLVYLNGQVRTWSGKNLANLEQSSMLIWSGTWRPTNQNASPISCTVLENQPMKQSEACTSSKSLTTGKSLLNMPNAGWCLMTLGSKKASRRGP